MQIHEALRRLNIVDARTFSELSPAGQEIRRKYEYLSRAHTLSLIDFHDDPENADTIRASSGKWIKGITLDFTATIFQNYPINRFLPVEPDYIQVGDFYYRIQEMQLVSAPLKDTLFRKHKPDFSKAVDAPYSAWFDHGFEIATLVAKSLIRVGHLTERRILEVPYP